MTTREREKGAHDSMTGLRVARAWQRDKRLPGEDRFTGLNFGRCENGRDNLTIEPRWLPRQCQLDCYNPEDVVQTPLRGTTTGKIKVLRVAFATQRNTGSIARVGHASCKLLTHKTSLGCCRDG